MNLGFGSIESPGRDLHRSRENLNHELHTRVRPRFHVGDGASCGLNRWNRSAPNRDEPMGVHEYDALRGRHTIADVGSLCVQEHRELIPLHFHVAVYIKAKVDRVDL